MLSFICIIYTDAAVLSVSNGLPNGTNGVEGEYCLVLLIAEGNDPILVSH